MSLSGSLEEPKSWMTEQSAVPERNCHAEHLVPARSAAQEPGWNAARSAVEPPSYEAMTAQTVRSTADRGLRSWGCPEGPRLVLTDAAPNSTDHLSFRAVQLRYRVQPKLVPKDEERHSMEHSYSRAAPPRGGLLYLRVVVGPPESQETRFGGQHGSLPAGCRCDSRAE